MGPKGLDRRWGPVGLSLLLLSVGFALGRWMAPSAAPQASWTRVQFDPQQPLPPTPDARELIPLPGPGGPGAGPPQEGEECPLLIYQDGQLYRFELPGPGPFGDPPELIPLDPRTPPPPSPLPPERGPDSSI
ncbi:hypothetical protein DV704_06395 [Meiothermus sp. QL-1]|uniref:hypothetical protein n=1 Tax=Meiothermus sp. QL-1 TaxID=2058095 RepID=UPI000E0B388C|nr:hypothetical protein [Meiothermus sp. QL-1]RDI95508.1 hypothetical protein DV704_06395 [Meiothermus sp. QL-1]